MTECSFPVLWSALHTRSVARLAPAPAGWLLAQAIKRIGEEHPGGWAYHVLDALGNARRLAYKDGWVTLAQSFKPYGDLLQSEGDGATEHYFAGEWRATSSLAGWRDD